MSQPIRREFVRPLILACALASGFAALPAAAGPFGDEMAKCLVRNTSAADKSSLVQWMFVAMGLHPDVKKFSSATPAQVSELNKKLADLMTSLLGEKCAKESREAYKNEGPMTIQTSFSVLGQVAAQELFTNPDVAKGLAELGTLVNEEKLKAVFGDEPK